MDDNKLTLDIFRKNDLKYHVCQIIYTNHSIIIPFTYNDYYEISLKFFLNELSRFENTKNIPIAYSPIILQTFTNFFACFEQFISTLYIIIYYYIFSDKILNEKKAIKIFRQDYNTLISEIFKLASCNKQEFYHTGIVNKIKELEDARNYILHGNFGHIKISKTKLPEAPLTMNYEDIMEEINIIINFINFFRYIIPKIDLMPQISIPLEGTVLYKSLDDYFYNVLCPYINLILNKHKLNPTRTYELSTTPTPPITSNISHKVLILIKAEEKNIFNSITMNSDNTNFYSKILDNFLDKNIVKNLLNENKFQLPKFIIE